MHSSPRSSARPQPPPDPLPTRLPSRCCLTASVIQGQRAAKMSWEARISDRGRRSPRRRPGAAGGTRKIENGALRRTPVKRKARPRGIGTSTEAWKCTLCRTGWSQANWARDRCTHLLPSAPRLSKRRAGSGAFAAMRPKERNLANAGAGKSAVARGSGVLEGAPRGTLPGSSSMNRPLVAIDPFAARTPSHPPSHTN